MSTIGSFRRTRWRWACAVTAVLLSGLLGSSIAAPVTRHGPVDQTAEDDAATQYVANLKRMLVAEIVPRIERGILDTATSRPPGLTIEVTENPSPYDVVAKIDADGSLIARLSIGYLTMHDAALDAVTLSEALQRPRELRPYLMYQLQLAHDNQRRRARGARPQRAMTFVEFIGVDPEVAQTVIAQPMRMTSRTRVEVASLGWTVSHLLVRADPKLAGLSSPAAARDGTGAAILAQASGWFPVPPVATALGIAEIERSAAYAFDERALLCRAARLIEAGVERVRTKTQAAPEPERAISLRGRVAEIRAQIARMRRDGACVPDGIVKA